MSVDTVRAAIASYWSQCDSPAAIERGAKSDELFANALAEARKDGGGIDPGEAALLREISGHRDASDAYDARCPVHEVYRDDLKHALVHELVMEGAPYARMTLGMSVSREGLGGTWTFGTGSLSGAIEATPRARVSDGRIGFGELELAAVTEWPLGLPSDAQAVTLRVGGELYFGNDRGSGPRVGYVGVAANVGLDVRRGRLSLVPELALGGSMKWELENNSNQWGSLDTRISVGLRRHY